MNLIVEDDGDIRSSLLEILDIWGYEAVGVADGLEALQYLCSGAAVDLILLDLMMPVMSGTEFLRERRKHPKLLAIPTILLTAAGSCVGLRSGDVSGFVSKPIDLSTFEELLLEYVSPSTDRLASNG